MEDFIVGLEAGFRCHVEDLIILIERVMINNR
jgi:hypothetical protein